MEIFIKQKLRLLPQAEIKKIGCQFELVIADSLSGESDCNFIDSMSELEQDYLVSIRSNHGLWISDPEKARFKERV